MPSGRVLGVTSGFPLPQLAYCGYSATEQRAKARNLARDPRAALHVSGYDFWHYAVVEGTAVLSAMARSAGDEPCMELLALHSALYGTQEADAIFRKMIAGARLVVPLRVSHLYGLKADGDRRPMPHTTSSG
jgi:hypothetical protein